MRCKSIFGYQLRLGFFTRWIFRNSMLAQAVSGSNHERRFDPRQPHQAFLPTALVRPFADIPSWSEELRVLLTRMQYPQNVNRVAADLINHDVVRVYDQFPRARYPPRAE